MNTDATSLDRLHDIVAAPPVSWWPPAPGWYIVMGVVVIGLIWLMTRQWRAWRTNAYRRAARRELLAARTVADISELLRRTALAVVPRSTIASLSGEQWPSWLAESLPQSMPPQVRNQLADGSYRPAATADELGPLREYALKWILRHRLSHPTQ